MNNYTNEEICNKVSAIFYTTPDKMKNRKDFVEFEVESSSLNTKRLFELCRFFDTEDIEVETNTRSGGYCSTCSYDYTVLVFTVKPTPEETNERLYNKVPKSN